MGFKTISQWNEEKQGDFFVLPNDGDWADVIFLYTSHDEVGVLDTHYITSPGYNGYVECTGKADCPACNYGDKGIRKQTSLFIPLFNLTKGKVEFWDRGAKFDMQVLTPSVFKDFPNPSEYVFRVTRHGAAGDPATRYQVTAQARNTAYPLAKILADNGLTFPDGYNRVCKMDLPADEISKMLHRESSPDTLGEYSYVPVPRGGSADAADVPPLPEINVPTDEYSAPPVDLPPVPDSVSAEGMAAGVSETDDSNDALDDVDF